MDKPAPVSAYEVSSGEGKALHRWGEVHIPINLYQEMGSPEAFELRVLRAENGRPITLILNLMEAKK